MTSSFTRLCHRIYHQLELAFETEPEFNQLDLHRRKRRQERSCQRERWGTWYQAEEIGATMGGQHCCRPSYIDLSCPEGWINPCWWLFWFDNQIHSTTICSLPLQVLVAKVVAKVVARCLRVWGDEDSLMSHKRCIHIQEIQLVKQQDWYRMFVYLVSWVAAKRAAGKRQTCMNTTWLS